jgi:uncharacterized iron-regulated membrane protein
MAALRRLWLNVHLWLGVGLMIPVILLGLSGSLLTFDDAFDRLLTPARYAVSAGAPAAPSRLLNAARSAVGQDFVVTSLRLPEHAGDPAIAQARIKGRPTPGAPPRGQRIWIDPVSARVLDVADPRGGLFGFAHQLHGQLMIPEIGRKVVGWAGWGLLISSLTGIWLWWPRAMSFLTGFRWARSTRFTYNLHHLVGFWIAIPLAILAATGVYISFPQSARTFTQVVTQAPAQPQPRGGEAGPQRFGAPPLDHTHLDIDQVAAIVRSNAANAELVAVTLPTRPRGDDAPSWRADVVRDGKTSTLQINDETGAVRPARANGDPTALLMRRLHDGGDQPMIWRAIIFLAGFAPAILGITGLIMWLRRPKRGAATAS